MENRLDARLRELPPAALHELLGRIAGIDEFRGWWRGRAPASPSLLSRLREQTLAAAAGPPVRFSARASPPPGGVAPSGPRPPARIPPGSPQQTAYAALLRSVFDGYGGIEFGEERILRFHAELFRHSAGDRGHRGRYRMATDIPSASPVGGMESPALRPADPLRIPGEMTTLAGWTASRLAGGEFHPLLVIPSFLLEFLAIRPFADGNARTGRVLAALLLLKSGYGQIPYLSLDRVISERWGDHMLALRRAQARRNLPRPDILPWLRAYLDALQAHAARLRPLFEERPREDLLSGNQRAVLALLDRHGEVTVRRACREAGIPRDTARQVLSRLLDLGLVRRAGAGRAARYLRPPPSAG